MDFGRSLGRAAFFPVLLVASSPFCSLAAVGAHPIVAEKDSRRAKAASRQARLDHDELVASPDKDFHPAKSAALTLILTLDSPRIPIAGSLRYKLELFNGGSEPYVFSESAPSFFKTGRLPADRVRLILRGPDGKESDVLSPLSGGSDIVAEEVHFPNDWSAERRAAWATAKNDERTASRELRVVLEPGERLRSRGDSGLGVGFRLLRSRSTFERVGEYSLRAELDTRFGKAGVLSAPVRFEVVR